jgi:hypothetical protein
MADSDKTRNASVTLDVNRKPQAQEPSLVATYSNKPQWEERYDDLCEACQKTLMAMLDKFQAGYATTRAKLTGGGASEVES